MKSLKLMLLLAGYPEKDMFSHESDLYVYKTVLSTSVINEWCKANGYSREWNCPVFTDQVTGKPMYDCAFQNYLPIQQWNGKDKNGYAIENPGIYQDLLTDGEYNIFYRNRVSGDLCLWCTAENLTKNIHHLNQIEWRK